MIRLALVAVFVLLAAAPAPPLTMAVRPRAFAFAPADFEITLRAETGGRSREVDLVVDGPRYYASSVIPVDTRPDEPWTLRPRWHQDLPAGTYVITATLTDCAPAGCGARESLHRVEHRILVLGQDEAIPELEP